MSVETIHEVGIGMVQILDGPYAFLESCFNTFGALFLLTSFTCLLFAVICIIINTVELNLMYYIHAHRSYKFSSLRVAMKLHLVGMEVVKS